MLSNPQCVSACLERAGARGKKHIVIDRLNDNSCLARRGLIPAKQSAACIGRGLEARCSGIGDLLKTGLLHQSHLIPYGDRTADSLRPGFGTVLHLVRQVMFQYNISELYSSAGFQNPIYLPETGQLKGRKIDNSV